MTVSIQLSGSVEHQRVEWSQGTIEGGRLAVWPLIGQLASTLASHWLRLVSPSLGRLAPCGQIGWGFSSDGLFMVRGISETDSVDKHCNWHLHQVKQLCLIRKISTNTFQCCISGRHMFNVPVEAFLYFLHVWHHINSKYNSNPSYFHKIPLQQSRHSEQSRVISVSQ